MDWIDLALNWDGCWALVKAVMKYQLSYHKIRVNS
jgi:hypothetical protein